MKKVIIAGNWKMNNTIEESLSLVRELKKSVKDIEDKGMQGIHHKEIIVFPPFTSLAAVRAEIKRGGEGGIMLGAQNMYFEEKGAFTGEISPLMLKDIGVDYVLLGHSERRHLFKEDNELINKKIKSALKNNIKAVLCAGETLVQREANKTKVAVEEQLSKGLKGINKEEIKKIVIAYEPVWAIGTGRNASPEQAEEAHLLIRNLLSSLFGTKTAEETIIIYGGSVNPDNSGGILSQKNINGVLVGGASLNAESFREIIRSCKE